MVKNSPFNVLAIDVNEMKVLLPLTITIYGKLPQRSFVLSYSLKPMLDVLAATSLRKVV